MFPFRVTYRLLPRTFLKLSFALRYGHWATITVTVLAALYLVDGIIRMKTEGITFGIWLGPLGLLISPVTILVRTFLIYQNHPHMNGAINYDFTDEFLAIIWPGMESRLLWTHMRKMKIAGGFLLLYINDSSAAMIPLSRLSEDQLLAIKEKMARTNQFSTD